MVISKIEQKISVVQNKCALINMEQIVRKLKRNSWNILPRNLT
jgi:hypothetical protein